MKPRTKTGKPTQPPGDVLKTGEIVTKERRRTPQLRVTLALTTNLEPDETLERDVIAAGLERGMDIDIWSRSRLAHVLDFDPEGQAVRMKFFGTPVERLSPELLCELCLESLAELAPYDDRRTWVDRALGQTLLSIQRPLTLLVAESGFGKSVACRQALEAHIEGGGYGLVLRHTDVSQAATLEQALSLATHRLRPALGRDESPLSLCADDRPLLVVVEDLNRSGDADRLVERLAFWAGMAADEKGGSSRPWRVICPIWPHLLGRLGDKAQKALQPAVLSPTPMTAEEGAAAVAAVAAIQGRTIGRAMARQVSSALGHDPLLIGLHTGVDASLATKVIGDYVSNALTRLPLTAGSDPIGAHRALRALAGALLRRRQLEPGWDGVSSWPELATHLGCLRLLADQRAVFGLEGSGFDLRLRFRHDRVRDWLFADAISALHEAGDLHEDITSDPAFAEVLGAALLRAEPFEVLLTLLSRDNPLALFGALQVCPAVDTRRADIVSAISLWLVDPANQTGGNANLAWVAQSMLARTIGPDIPALARMFQGGFISAGFARLRNGDLGGGLNLFATDDVGVTWRDRDEVIAEAKLRFGPNLLAGLNELLGRTELNSATLAALLRLTGAIGEPALSAAIQAAWERDTERLSHLKDYLWACARCCDEQTAENLLGSVCAAWADLPDEEVEKHAGSPKNGLAADSVRMGFSQHPPIGALPYFAQRAEQEDLDWPITYMLHAVDHPIALTLLAYRVAGRGEKPGNWMIQSTVTDHWRRRREDGVEMSAASRDAMRAIWRDAASPGGLRRAALSFWAAGSLSPDLADLRDATLDPVIGDIALRQRLLQKDRSAIPDLSQKLQDGSNDWIWWSDAWRIWDASFLLILSTALSRRGPSTSKSDKDTNLDYALASLLLRLPPCVAEPLLIEHWPKLGTVPRFFQLALYLATPTLLAMAARVVTEHPEPKRLFRFVSSTFAIRTVDHPGVRQESQVLALEPYFNFLEPLDLRHLAEACNESGWFETRRRLLDPLIDNRRLVWRPADTAKMCDEVASKERLWMLDKEIDWALETGRTWAEMRDEIEAWSLSRGDLRGLQVFASALQHAGSRSDLPKLAGLATEVSDPDGAAVVANAVFAVQRRTMS